MEDNQGYTPYFRRNLHMIERKWIHRCNSSGLEPEMATLRFKKGLEVQISKMDMIFIVRLEYADIYTCHVSVQEIIGIWLCPKIFWQRENDENLGRHEKMRGFHHYTCWVDMVKHHPGVRMYSQYHMKKKSLSWNPKPILQFQYILPDSTRFRLGVCSMTRERD